MILLHPTSDNKNSYPFNYQIKSVEILLPEVSEQFEAEASQEEGLGGDIAGQGRGGGGGVGGGGGGGGVNEREGILTCSTPASLLVGRGGTSDFAR